MVNDSYKTAFTTSEAVCEIFLSGPEDLDGLPNIPVFILGFVKVH